MLNYIWLGLIILAIIIGGFTDHLKEVGDKGLEMAGFAVMNVALPLAGIMALWLGIMRLAERAGLVMLLSRVLRPLMTRLFPEVPPDHPGMGAIVMNMAANMLGLGNAAMPLGLRAMRHLESLNPHPGTATNAMCTFLAINTSSIQLIPATAIAILAANHSQNPTAIVGTSLLATACAAFAGVSMAKFLEHLPVFRLPRPIAPVTGKFAADQTTVPGSIDTSVETSGPESSGEPPGIQETVGLRSLKWWGAAMLAAFGLLWCYFFLRLGFPSMVGLRPVAEAAQRTTFIRVVDAVSKISIPFIISAFPLYAVLRQVKVYEEFVDGAKEGFEVAVRIIPYLVAILVAIAMFRAAGGIDLLSRLLAPVMEAIQFPSELLPLVLMRPLSGSGTLGIFTELVKQLGPDSLITRTAGTIFGSTETTFYVLAVYFGAVGIKRTRYALLAGLTADLVGVIASVCVCRIVFGSGA
jgi:spore maturation protein SpmA